LERKLVFVYNPVPKLLPRLLKLFFLLLVSYPFRLALSVGGGKRTDREYGANHNCCDYKAYFHFITAKVLIFIIFKYTFSEAKLKLYNASFLKIKLYPALFFMAKLYIHADAK
jgi:hypothetical protein